MNLSPATALVAAGSLLGAALAFSCSPTSSSASDNATPQVLTQTIRRQEATRVRTQAVQVREMERSLTTTTVVESEAEIQLIPRIAGVVTSIAVEEGDRVEQGQALAQLDDREARATLREAQINLEEARENVPKLELSAREAKERSARSKLSFDQASRVFERNEKAALISQSDLEELRMTRDGSELDWNAAKISWERAEQELNVADTAIARAQVAVDRQELNLTYTRITAPFAGIIATRSIKVGDSASAAAAAFTLTDPDQLRAIFFRPQRELSMFRSARLSLESNGSEALEIRVRAEAYPERSFNGTLQLVSPTVAAESGSFRVTVSLDPASNESEFERLLPGMLVRLAIVTDRHADALVVPKRAVRREGDTNFLFIDQDGSAHRVEVVSGFTTDEDIEVTPVAGDSLAAGDMVIVIGNRDLEEGSAVNAKAWTGSEDEDDSLNETTAASKESH